MMDKKVKIIADRVTAVIDTDDGVAVRKPTDSGIKSTEIPEKQSPQDDRKWYIGIVPPRHEKKIIERLEKLGIKSFVAVHEETRMWSRNRQRKVEVIVIPAKLFIYCTDKERHEILEMHIGVLRFFVNIAGQTDKSGHRPLATIPDHQVLSFQNMLKNSPIPIEFSEYCFMKGDRVRIKSGVLKGVEGIASKHSQGKTKLYINIEGLGSASTEVDTSTLEIIK